MIYPQAANQLNSMGFNQERLENYLYERTSIPFEEMGPEEVSSFKEKIEGSRDGDMLLADTIPPDRISFFEEALKPGGRIPILITPKDINKVVSGSGTGVPGSVVWMSYIKAVYEWTSHQTRKITGATITKEGR
jgi:hypothetical protein